MIQGRLHSISRAQGTRPTNRERTRHSLGRWSSSSQGRTTRTRRDSIRKMPMKGRSHTRTMEGNHIIRVNINKTDRVVGIPRTMISKEQRTLRRRPTMMIMGASHTRQRKRPPTSWSRRTHSLFPISLPSQSLPSKRMNIL